MVTVDVQIAAHLRAVVDHLIDRGVPTGYGKRPPNVGWQSAPGQSPFVGYAVVWRSGAIDAQGSMLTGDVDEARPSVQVDCIGADPEQADQLADQVAVALLDQTLEVEGRRVLRIWQEVGNTATKQPDEMPAIYKSADRYRIWSVPQ